MLIIWCIFKTPVKFAKLFIPTAAMSSAWHQPMHSMFTPAQNTVKNQYATHYGTVSCLDGGTEKRLLMKCVRESEPDHSAAAVCSQLAPVWVGMGPWILMSSFTLSAQEERTNKETRRWKKQTNQKNNTKNHKFTCRRSHRRTRIQAVSDNTSECV